MKNYSKAFLVCFLMICTYQAKSQQINRALNQNISGFPVIDRNPFENLIDGNDATVWTISEASPANFIKIDFKNEQQIDRVLFKNIKGVENIQVSIISSGESTEVFNGSYPQNHLISFTPRKGTSIRFDFQGKEIAFIGDIEVYSYESQPVMVNQVGFNLLDVKRFTAPLASDNTPFIVKNNKDQEVYSGIIEKNIGDFSDFNPNHSGPYYIEVNGKETGRSFPFKIEPYLIERTSYYPAMAFMADVRCWYGCAVDYNPTAAGTGCSFLGVAWRDSHQFSFEIPTLLSLY